MTVSPIPHRLSDVGHAGVALDGVHSGDVHVVVPFEAGMLFAVIDGLGHGFEAARVARRAADVLATHPADPVVVLVERCHDALRKTRGVVMSLASLVAADSSLTWTGVGNVETLLLRAARTADPAREAVQLRGGVVGYQLPPLRAATLKLARGDTLIMATDGIRSGFATGLAVEHGPQVLANRILAQHARGTDDALVLVARYLGDSP